MVKNPLKNKIFIVAGLVLFIAVGITGYLWLTKPNEENFKAPGKDWNSPKKIEDYFVERLRMTPQEASEIRSKPGVNGKVTLRINPNVTLEGLAGNLYYYGFVRDEDTLRYALGHTKDTTPSEKAITIGRNGTIDTNAEYRISEDMDVWEIADVLLNKPTGHFSFDEYGYFFMP